MIILLVSLLLSSGSGRTYGVMEDRVDMIELNHLNDNVHRQYNQLLFYDWNPELRMFVIVDWRMVRSEFNLTKNYRTKEYQLIFDDHGVQRRVISKSYRETHTTYDPERNNERYFNSKYRRLLSIPPQ